MALKEMGKIALQYSGSLALPKLDWSFFEVADPKIDKLSLLSCKHTPLLISACAKMVDGVNGRCHLGHQQAILLASDGDITSNCTTLKDKTHYFGKT